MPGAMSVGIPRYCTKSSSSFDYTRTDIVNPQFVDIALQTELSKGYYVCAGDELTSLKVGTLDDARSDCGESGLMTPDLCDENQSTSDTLISLVRDADRISNGLTTRREYMWTGIRRHNMTHYRSYDLKRWVTLENLGTKTTRTKSNCFFKTACEQLTHDRMPTMKLTTEVGRQYWSNYYHFPSQVCASIYQSNDHHQQSTFLYWANGIETGIGKFMMQFIDCIIDCSFIDLPKCQSHHSQLGCECVCFKRYSVASIHAYFLIAICFVLSAFTIRHLFHRIK